MQGTGKGTGKARKAATAAAAPPPPPPAANNPPTSAAKGKSAPSGATTATATGGGSKKKKPAATTSTATATATKAVVATAAALSEPTPAAPAPAPAPTTPVAVVGGASTTTATATTDPAPTSATNKKKKNKNKKPSGGDTQAQAQAQAQPPALNQPPEPSTSTTTSATVIVAATVAVSDKQGATNAKSNANGSSGKAKSKKGGATSTAGASGSTAAAQQTPATSTGATAAQKKQTATDAQGTKSADSTAKAAKASADSSAVPVSSVSAATSASSGSGTTATSTTTSTASSEAKPRDNLQDQGVKTASTSASGTTPPGSQVSATGTTSKKKKKGKKAKPTSFAAHEELAYIASFLSGAQPASAVQTTSTTSTATSTAVPSCYVNCGIPATLFVDEHILITAANTAEIEVVADLKSPMTVSVPGKDEINVTVSHLPPLTLRVELPTTYPSDDPPLFCLSSCWLTLSQLATSCQHFDRLWSEHQNEFIILRWMQWLKTELIASLGIKSVNLSTDEVATEIEDARAVVETVNDQAFGVDVMPYLIEYNKKQATVVFRRSAHTCSICLTDFPGTEFSELGDCGHMFCNDCMRTFCATHITSGEIELLHCPQTGCNKDIDPNVIRSLVSPEQYARYEHFLITKSMEGRPDVTWCPRCQHTVIGDLHLQLGPCLYCHYSFCLKCRSGWHAKTPCVRVEERLAKIIAQERLATTKEMAAKLAKRRKEVELEIKDLDWIKANTKVCPHCHIAIEKTSGCNHMYCQHCGKEFCYHCCAKIVGYSHFSESNCFLFHYPETEVLRPRFAPPPRRENPKMREKLQTLPSGHPDLYSCPRCKYRHAKVEPNNQVSCMNCKLIVSFPYNFHNVLIALAFGLAFTVSLLEVPICFITMKILSGSFVYISFALIIIGALPYLLPAYLFISLELRARQLQRPMLP
ncbi:E3 ubiquitin-protein ligase RNF14 [Pelomyxa schiedti]|nr:E3 ubiquitin-protein ligase RNF14 [Pelomyxa schiedti]